MPGIVTVAETDGGGGKLYLDESGGYLLIGVSNQGYFMTHKLHIAPFSTSEGGSYNTTGSGQETNVLETACNLVAMMAACYKSTTTVQALAAYQVKSDHTGVLPTALDLSSATHAGTNGASSENPVEVLIGLTAHGSDFSRWQLHLHGVAGASPLSFGRESVNVAGSGGLYDLAQYLMGLGDGAGIGGVGAGLLTQVVTHAGEPIVQPMFFVGSVSKRIRRRFRWL